VHALVGRRVTQGGEPLAGFGGGRLPAVGLEGARVPPDLEDHELIRLPDALRHLRS
jgi:hypothetical protein